MKKLIILMIGILLFASINKQNDEFLEYTNKIINYNFYIKNLNKIKSPFYEVMTKNVLINKNNNSLNNISKKVKITLLSVLDKKAYVKVEKFLGDQIISIRKKWLKLNDKISNCKLIKINDTDVLFKCKNKFLHKTINEKIPTLREEK